MQYLVSVITDTASLATPAEEAAIDVFNEQLPRQTVTAVFACDSLAGPGSATAIDNRGEEPMISRRALPGVEGVPDRLLDHRGGRPRRRAQARHRRVEGLQPEDRGAAVLVNAADAREAVTQAYQQEWSLGDGLPDQTVR